jgi:hypothetical protein
MSSEHINKRLAEVWDEGWCAGASNVFAMNGEKPLPQGNPYRDMAAQQGEEPTDGR